MERKKSGFGVSIPVLSKDILIRVGSLLPPDALARSCIVCKSWNNIIKDSELWKTLYENFQRQLKPVCKEDDANEKSIQLAESGVVGDWEALLVKEQRRALIVCGTGRIKGWKGHSGRVECCRLHTRTIVTGASDGTVHVWSVDPVRCLETYVVPNKSTVLDLEFDENKVLAVSRAAVHIWRRKTGLPLRRVWIPNQHIYSMCYADPEVFLGCGDGTVRVFDLYSSKCSRIFRQHSDHVSCLVVDVKSSFLATGSADGTVQLCDSISGQKFSCLLPSSPPTEVNCLHLLEESLTLVGGTTAGQVYAWDIRELRLLWKVRVVPNSVTALHAPFYDTSTLVVGNITGMISVMDMKFGTVLNQFAPSEAPGSKTQGLNEQISMRTSSRVVLNENPISKGNPTRNLPPILCLRAGMTMLVTTHPNGTVNVWKFTLEQPK